MITHNDLIKNLVITKVIIICIFVCHVSSTGATYGKNLPQDNTNQLNLSNPQNSKNISQKSSYAISINDQIRLSGEVDSYLYPGQSGEKLNLYLMKVYNKKMSLKIMTPENELLQEIINSSYDIETNYLLLPQSGNYIIYVDAMGNTTGDYTLNLFKYHEQWIDNSITSGRFSDEGEQHFYKFNAQSGDVISLYLDKSYKTSLSLKIQTPDGDFIFEKGFSDYDIEVDYLTLLQTGTYIISVDASGRTTGNYTLYFFNHQSEGIDLSHPDQPITIKGRIDLPGEKDCYSFLGTSGDTMSLYLDQDSDKTMNIQILNPDGSELVTHSYSKYNIELDHIVLSQSGTYTIIADASSSVTCNYLLNVFKYNSEPIEFPFSSDVISLTSCINIAGEQNYYSYSGLSGEHISLYLDFLYNNMNSMRLEIIQPDGTYLVENQFQKQDIEINDLQLLESGVYTIIVDSYSSLTCDYQLNIFKHQPEWIELSSTGDYIHLTQTISSAGERDIYSFKGESGDSFCLYLCHDNQNMSVRIIQPDQTTLLEKSFSKLDIESGYFTLTEPGIYTIIFDASGNTICDYSFYLSKLILNPIVLENNSSEISMTGSIRFPGDQTIYTFQGNKQDTFRLYLKNDNSKYLGLTILKPDGSKMIYQGCCSSDIERDMKLEETGEYQIIIDASGNRTCEYSFNFFKEIEHDPICFENCTTLKDVIKIMNILTGIDRSCPCDMNHDHMMNTQDSIFILQSLSNKTR